MKKVLIDLGRAQSKAQAQELVAHEMGFDERYGRNLDALYDELTSICEPTAVGIFMPLGDPYEMDFDLMLYFDRIREVFMEAEEENDALAVIFGDLTDNPGHEDDYDDLFDDEDDWDDYDEDMSDKDDYDDKDDLDEADMPGDDDVLVLDLSKYKK